ncbi:MAG: flagellar type III secretion system pore protein FliP [Candidatus Electryonea clarkiae]|nr:flagellar type III secretion system pore protein FliP [Candidatus Electryonea clarkiae]MDP8287315.1 flagellar type III secretion system pore protein FliP [Candidatus Electryonea clarkiae]
MKNLNIENTLRQYLFSNKYRLIKIIFCTIIIVAGTLSSGYAQAPTLPKITVGVDQAGNPQDFAVTIQILLLLTVLSLAPSILIMTTSFIRIVIALHFLRQAIGTQSLPPNQMLVGLALFLTMFIMAPTITEIYENAWQPYAKQEIVISEAWNRAQQPLREFMLKHTREKDLQVFVRMAEIGQPDSPDDLPLRIIIPGFVISELRVGFQIGFLIYMPMLIIDMVVASILMSMGMMMLPPVMISLPFKLLMFVLVDGWYLIVQSLVESFK